MTDRMFIEINLKVKCDEIGDIDLSKCVITHSASNTEDTMNSLVTSWLSTVEFIYAPVQNAVEATLAATILRGPHNFIGKIIAWTARNRKSKIILYDSEAAGTVTETGDAGSVHLSRNVVAVSLGEKLLVHICVSGGDDGVKFRVCQQDSKWNCNIGSYELQVVVTWTSNSVERRQKVFKNFGRTLLLC